VQKVIKTKLQLTLYAIFCRDGGCHHIIPTTTTTTTKTENISEFSNTQTELFWEMLITVHVII